MKKIIFSFICIICSYTAIGQISQSSAMSDRDYVNLVNFYLHKKQATLTIWDNNNNIRYLMPNGEFLKRGEIVEKYGLDFFQHLKYALTRTIPRLLENKQDSFCILEKKRTINQKQLVSGVSVIGISTILFCASNAGLNQAIKEADNPNKIKTLNNAKIAMGIVCGVGALTGTILAICSIKTEIKVNKNLQFDVNGNYIGLNKNF